MFRDLDMELPHVGDANRLECSGHNDVCCSARQWSTHEKNQTKMVCALSLLVAEKKGLTPNSLADGAEPRWLSFTGEVGGRWSGETRSFLNQLAKARARSESILMRKRLEQVWRLRWASMLSCVAVRGATPPSHEVDREFRYTGLA